MQKRCEFHRVGSGGAAIVPVCRVRSVFHEDGARHDGEPVREATLDGGDRLVYEEDSKETWRRCDAPVDLSKHGRTPASAPPAYSGTASRGSWLSTRSRSDSNHSGSESE
jgi:hypothetical protein